jgi:hypothetical protein
MLVRQQVLVVHWAAGLDGGRVPPEPAAEPLEPSGPNLAALVVEAKRLRAEKRLTLEVIAERAGMTVNGVGNLFRGARTGSLESWWRLARGLGVEFADLVKALGPTAPGGRDSAGR